MLHNDNALTNLEVPPINSKSRLRKVVATDEPQIEWPDSVVLSQGEGSQSTVKGSSGPGDLALLHQELTIINPDSRHL